MDKEEDSGLNTMALRDVLGIPHYRVEKKRFLYLVKQKPGIGLAEQLSKSRNEFLTKSCTKLNSWLVNVKRNLNIMSNRAIGLSPSAKRILVGNAIGRLISVAFTGCSLNNYTHL